MQHSDWIGVVFKRIERNNDVRRFLGRKTKLANILNACSNRMPLSYFQHVRSDINAKYSACAISREFNCFESFAATEIDNRFAFKRLEKAFAKQGGNFGFPHVCNSAARVRSSGRHFLQKFVLEFG